jgi:hypothetical protein
MTERLALRAAAAAQTFPQPHGCAQAIAAAYGHQTDTTIMGMLGALSGGVGGCGLTCGAFTGGALVLNGELLRLGMSQGQCYGPIDELRLCFELADGTTSCQELTGLRFDEEEVVAACRARVARTIEQVGEIIARASAEPLKC